MKVTWETVRRRYSDICTYRSVSRRMRKNTNNPLKKFSLPKKQLGAYIYADESGHSGKDIFNEASPIYYQGAIISVGDIDNIVAPIIQKYCVEYKLDRLHGYELSEGIVNEICVELLDSLSCSGSDLI